MLSVDQTVLKRITFLRHIFRYGFYQILYPNLVESETKRDYIMPIYLPKQKRR